MIYKTDINRNHLVTFTSLFIRTLAVLIAVSLIAITAPVHSAADSVCVSRQLAWGNALWGNSLNSGDPNPDYPGIGLRGNIVDIGLRSVLAGLQAFYQVYGVWPESWRQVTESGLWQTEILGYHDEVIDPDDTFLGFLGDIYYEPRSATQEQAVVRMLMDIDGTVIYTHLVDPLPTAREIIEGFATALKDDSFNKYLNDEQWLKFLTIKSMLHRDICLLARLKGRAPASMQELLDEGVSPIDASSINPLTGDHFYFDDRPLNLTYEQAEGKGFRLCHLEENGEHPTHPFFF